MKSLAALALPLGLGLAQQFGPWTLQGRADPATGEGALYAVTVYAARGFQDSGVLMVRCRWGRPDVFLATQRAMTGGRIAAVYRFDRNAPKPAQFLGGSSGSSAFVPEDQVWNFFQGLQNASRLTLRVQDYQGRQRSYDFNVSGFRRIAPRFACFRRPDPAAATRPPPRPPPPPPRPPGAARYVNYLKASDLRRYFGFSVEPADGGYHIHRGRVGFKVAPLLHGGSLWLPLQFLGRFGCRAAETDGRVARVACGPRQSYLLDLQPWNP